VPGKRSAHERLPELIGAAVRVFIRDGYRSARMSDVVEILEGFRDRTGGKGPGFAAWRFRRQP
jgi:hypothetical protein